MNDATKNEDELVDSASDPMLRVGHSGRIEAANEAASDLWGIPARELLGRDIAELVEETGEPLVDRLRKRGSGAVVFHLPVPGGGRREIRAWGILAPAANEGLYVLLRAKGSASSPRSSEFEHFLNRAAHDLNEPLRKIYSFGQQLKRRAGDKLDGECKDYLDRMQSASERMHAMVEGLLGMSRVGRDGVSLRDVDLNEVIQKVLDKHRLRIQRSKAKVEISTLPSARTDPMLLGQLLSNILDNALTFVRPGEAPDVKISGRDDDAGTTIVIEDRGIGIESENLERIFRGFERLHGRRELGGVGLGLAVCRKIAKLLNARLFAESEPGKGSRFVVVLPPGGDYGAP